jgi:hypothetical protein
MALRSLSPRNRHIDGGIVKGVNSASQNTAIELTVPVPEIKLYSGFQAVERLDS